MGDLPFIGGTVSDFSEKTEPENQGTSFDKGVGPAPEQEVEPTRSFKSLSDAIKNTKLPNVTPFITEPEIQKHNYPEYMEEKNAKDLFDQEVEAGEGLSPLSFIYYLSLDNDDRTNKDNTDLLGSIDEQKKIFKLYSSKEKLTPVEWETALQNHSGWKEIKAAIGEDDFFRKTSRYLRVKGIIAKLNNDKKLSDALLKTADLLKTNLNGNTNGA